MTITAEQIRTFHLTGKGLNDCIPFGPLRPALIPHAAPSPQRPELSELYAHALREQRGKARSRFLENLRYCRDRMQELLTLDDGRNPALSRSPGALSASLGNGISFFDSGALAVALQTSSAVAVAQMEPARRRRCESAVAAMNEALRDAATEPSYWEFPVADTGAIAFCERQLDKLVAALRAIRVARLELESSYDAAVHDAALARFTWESADAEELAAMPAVVVMDSAERVAENSLTSFGRLLRSGLPMQILITCPPFYTGDLAFMAVAHREAFVAQSSTACPAHLNEALMDMTHTLRPAVAVVSTKDPALFVESRAFPMYVYDPDGGEDWVQRFRLYTGPMPHADLNAVHVAALSPDMLRHFRVLPQASWNSEQVELWAYLAQFGKQAPLSVPFLTVVDEKGEQQHAVVTRELVLLARDRQRAWRLLEELSEAGKPAAAVVDVEKVKQDAAKDAIYRAVAMLAGVAPAATAVAVPVPVPKVAPAKPDAAAKPAAAPAATEVPPDPYIDSELCTSCNDCMKINSRMFQYNADKQAYIGDPAAGTFSELVKSAEGCPARCIHPGVPRAGDKTATPQLIARAAKFK